MEYSGDKFIDRVLDKCLENLNNTKSDIYLNESDFKFSFAQAAHNCGATEIILEYPIMTSDLYSTDDGAQTRFVESYYNGRKCTNCSNHNTERCLRIGCNNLVGKYTKDRTFVDVYFKYNATKYYVELKYKLLSVNTKINRQRNIDRQQAAVRRYDNSFILGDQMAVDLGLYAIYEDIERMENIKRKYNDCRSLCILITNDKAYWNWNTGLAEGVSLAGEQTINNEQVQYYGKRELQISNSYPIRKKDFKEICVAENDPNRITENNLFRCLVINLGDSDY